MIVEKPKCPYCHGVCGSNNPDPIYLKKIEDGWKCPQCNLEFYEINELEQTCQNDNDIWIRAWENLPDRIKDLVKKEKSFYKQTTL